MSPYYGSLIQSQNTQQRTKWARTQAIVCQTIQIANMSCKVCFKQRTQARAKIGPSVHKLTHLSGQVYTWVCQSVQRWWGCFPAPAPGRWQGCGCHPAGSPRRCQVHSALWKCCTDFLLPNKSDRWKLDVTTSSRINADEFQWLF